MSRKSKPSHDGARAEHPVRTHEPVKPPLRDPPRPPGTNRQAPLSSGVEQQAQKLIHAAGSTEKAKVAVDAAAEREHVPEFREDHFAQRWGFRSRCDLLKASTPASATGGGEWWTTQLPDTRWIVWSREAMSSTATFDSRAEAIQSLAAGAMSPAPAAASRFGEFPEAFNG
jgi:hypothetical protein